MSVTMSVCSAQVCLEQSISIFLGQRAIGEQLDHSESDQRTLREQSEGTQREMRVIQSEPIILRLVQGKSSRRHMNNETYIKTLKHTKKYTVASTVKTDNEENYFHNLYSSNSSISRLGENKLKK